MSTLKEVVFGLLYLFIAPNPTDPLNREAAEQMLKNEQEFAATVKSTMKGQQVRDVKFDKVM